MGTGDLLRKADNAVSAKRDADLVDLVAGVRERVRPALPPCWRCGTIHFQDEPCDEGGWGAAKAIDKRTA